MSDPDRTAPHASGGPAPAPGATVGRFVLGPELGRGAFGVVHRAYDPALGREVAVKLPTAADATPDLVERFTREARAAAGLRHPNVVAVFDVGDDAGRPFIAMELVDGPTLAERLRERVDPRQAAEWVRDLALALHHAHTAGVLHRDVKPGNVLVDAGRRARLTDFGISKLAPAGPADGGDDNSAPAATRDGTVMGSPGYMSPEQARGDVAAVGPASDQYSLGVVLYELLTGRRPFPGSAREAMRRCADPDAHPPPPRDVDPAVPIGLEAVALMATRKSAADRYASAADLAVDLQRWLKGDAVSAPLRVRGAVVWVCPGCGRANKTRRPECYFCGAALAGVAASDSADLPPPGPDVPQRRARPAFAYGLSERDVGGLDGGLKLLGLRLRMMLWALAVAVGGSVLAFFVDGKGGGGPWSVQACTGLAVLALLAPGPLLGLVGTASCARRLPLAGRGLAVAALACQLFALGLTGAGVVLRADLVGPPGADAGWPPWVLLMAAGGLAGAVGWVCEWLFLERVAWYLDLEHVVGTVGRLLLVAAAVVFGPPLALFAAGFVLVPGAVFVLAVVLALLVCAGVVAVVLNWMGVIDEVRYKLRSLEYWTDD